jgi:hypothetical protein
MTIKKQARDYKMPSPKAIVAMDEFSKTLDEWDRMEEEANKVNYEELCQKLQQALAKSFVEAEELEKVIAYWRNEVGARDIVIRYLESRKV